MSYRNFKSPKNKSKSSKTRSLKKTAYVATEGKTEAEYLNFLNSKLKIIESDFTITFVPSKHTDPTGIVNDLKEYRSRNIYFSDDSFWCIIDIDQHTSIIDAMNNAINNSIHFLYSNQCFELWLLLHFQSQTAYMNRRQCFRSVSKHIKDYGKTNVNFSLLDGKFSVAKERSLSLANGHLHSGTRFPHDNPVSLVYELVDYLGISY